MRGGSDKNPSCPSDFSVLSKWEYLSRLARSSHQNYDSVQARPLFQMIFQPIRGNPKSHLHLAISLVIKLSAQRGG